MTPDSTKSAQEFSQLLQNNSVSCPICESSGTEIVSWATATDVEYLTTQDIFYYYHCTHCDLLFIHPVPVDRLQEIYPKNYYSYVSSGTTVVDRIKLWLDRRMFTRILQKLSAQKLRILDVGGGSGEIVDQLRKLDPRIVLTQIVDMNSGAAMAAQTKGHLYFTGRIEDFRSPDRFDLIILLNLIEHLSFPGAVLQNLRNLLSDDGLILIKTPNFRSLDASIFRHRNWGGYHCPRHWVLFSKNSFLNLAASTGLEAVWFRYTQGAPFWAISVLALLSQKGWIKVDSEHPAYTNPLYPLLNAFFASVDFLRLPFSRTSQMFALLKRRH